MGRYDKFQRIAEIEFGKIVLGSDDFGHKLRIYFTDRSYLDVFISTQTEVQRFSFHWERRHLDKRFFRLDNTPDPHWNKVNPYPLHFHHKFYNNVINSPFKSKKAEELFREFMLYIQDKISKTHS